MKSVGSYLLVFFMVMFWVFRIIVALTGKIFTMPGLPRVPAAENIDINENNEIVGIF